MYKLFVINMRSCDIRKGSSRIRHFPKPPWLEKSCSNALSSISNCVESLPNLISSSTSPLTPFWGFPRQPPMSYKPLYWSFECFDSRHRSWLSTWWYLGLENPITAGNRHTCMIRPKISRTRLESRLLFGSRPMGIIGSTLGYVRRTIYWISEEIWFCAAVSDTFYERTDCPEKENCSRISNFTHDGLLIQRGMIWASLRTA